MIFYLRFQKLFILLLCQVDDINSESRRNALVNKQALFGLSDNSRAIKEFIVCAGNIELFISKIWFKEIFSLLLEFIFYLPFLFIL